MPGLFIPVLVRYNWSCKFPPQASAEYISFLNDGLPNDYYLRPVDSSGPLVTNGAAPPLSPRSVAPYGNYITSHTITLPRTQLHYLAHNYITSHTIILPRT